MLVLLQTADQATSASSGQCFESESAIGLSIAAAGTSLARTGPESGSVAARSAVVAG